MILPPFKKYIPLSIKFFAGAAVLSIIVACISFPYGDRVLSLFAPETMGPTRFQPFFFTLDSAYYRYGDDEKIYDEKAANIREWSRHFKSEVNEAAIQKVVYDYVIDMYPPLSIMKADTNACLLWMVKHKDEETFKYLQFARQCEALASYKYPPNFYWDYNTQITLQDSAEKAKKIKEALAVLPTVKSDFIKLRYAYQLVRLACYNNRFRDCIDYYDQYVEPLKSNSIIKYRALSLKARALYKCGAPQYSQYCYAMVFDRCNSRRMDAKQGFYWAAMYYNTDLVNKYSDKSNATGYCKSNLEKIPVYALQSMLNAYDYYNLLDSIYRIDPKSEMLEWLVTRGVNQLEFDILPERGREWGSDNAFNTDSMLGLSGRWGLTGDSYASGYGYQYGGINDLTMISPHDVRGTIIGNENEVGFLNFVSRCATNGNTRNPGLWNLCAAYLQCMNGHYGEAKAFVAKVHEPANPVVTGQKMIIDILIKVRELNPQTIDGAKENEIAADFELLNRCGPAMRCADARSALLLQLSAKYAAKSDRLKASLCEAASSWSMNLKEMPRLKPLDEMIAFAERKNKTPFEQLIAHSAATDLQQLYQLKGTVLLTQYKYKEAVEAFRKTNDTLTYTGPFYVGIQHCHHCNEDSDMEAEGKGQMIAYTKLEFAQRMVQLQTKTSIAKGEDLAQAYFLLANATYNLSFYGYCWDMTEYPYHAYWWRGNPEYYSQPDSYYDPFFNCQPAENYYIKAMSVTRDKEFAAECCFMIAQCEQGTAYNESAGTDRSGRNQYFKQLKTDYPATQFYKDAIQECGYFKYYVAKN